MYWGLINLWASGSGVTSPSTQFFGNDMSVGHEAFVDEVMCPYAWDDFVACRAGLRSPEEAFFFRTRASNDEGGWSQVRGLIHLFVWHASDYYGSFVEGIDALWE